jgi:hypothetical protein
MNFYQAGDLLINLDLVFVSAVGSEPRSFVLKHPHVWPLWNYLVDLSEEAQS